MTDIINELLKYSCYDYYECSEEYRSDRPWEECDSCKSRRDARDEILRLRRLLFDVMAAGDILRLLLETENKSDDAIQRWREVTDPIYQNCSIV